MEKLSGVRLGTSAFTAAGWPGTFYPEGMKPEEYLTYYATQFDAVELDNTLYRTPELATVRGGGASTSRQADRSVGSTSTSIKPTGVSALPKRGGEPRPDTAGPDIARLRSGSG
jgi:hypothetical protein